MSEDSPEAESTADDTQESGHVGGSKTVVDRKKARLSRAENRYCDALVRVACKRNTIISVTLLYTVISIVKVCNKIFKD